MGKQLTQQMYGGEFDFNGEGLFELRTGQMRGRDQLTHNSGWYNADGEKLGWGDLNLGDFQRIMAGLEESELFVILGESDSYWNFVTKPALIGSMAQTKPDVNTPGSEYIAEHAMYIIAKGEISVVSMFGNRKPEAEYTDRSGLRMKVLSRDEARKVIFDACTGALAEGKRVEISVDAPTSAGRFGWIMELDDEQAIIDFRDGTDLLDIVPREFLSVYQAI